MTMQWSCARCGETFDRASDATGAKASWCRRCRLEYNKQYARRARQDPKYAPPSWSKCADCGTGCMGIRCLACHLVMVRRNAKPKPVRKPSRQRTTPPRIYGDKRYTDLREIVLAEETHCGICHEWVDRSLHGQNRMAATIDHIVPLNAGGAPFDRANVRLAHRICNSKAGNAAKSYQERERVGLMRAALWIGERLSA